MAQAKGDFLDFLDGLYGRDAIETLMQRTDLARGDLAAASDAFVPVFLENLNKLGGTVWPQEMVEAIEAFHAQSAELVRDAPKGKSASPFSLYKGQTGDIAGAMSQLHRSFMGEMAQAQWVEQVSKTTGIAPGKLETLFPLLTTYGLMPLMPFAMPPAMDDPVAWMDYWGAWGRRGFRQASRDLDAMPSPLNAAFEGLLSGLFPKAEPEEPIPSPSDSDKVREIREAGLELQANYIKGLNSLFEQYSKG